jgi:hypothetical protein
MISETKRDFEANSRLAAKIKVTEENLAGNFYITDDPSIS